MEIEKAQLTVNEHDFKISVPFSKFVESKRTVSGWASIDNIDQEKDCVTAEASKKAFANFRGNVREQHNKDSAVGKMVNFNQQDFFEPTTGQVYSGIYVDAYISKGAQDTWEKVLDGTLSGFSVKGSILKSHTEYVPDLDSTVRFIDEYFIYELSLVDNPGNEFCNVMSIQKSADGQDVITSPVDVKIENVFWCRTDGIAVPSESDSITCRKCGQDMEITGWFESVSQEERVEKIKQVLNDANIFSKSLEEGQHVTKGGTDMPEQENNVENVNETTEPVVEEQTNEVQENTDSEKVSEVTDENEPDLQGIAKALNDIQSSLTKVFDESKDKEAALTEIRETVQGVEKSVDKRLTELMSKHEELQKDFSDFKSGLDNVEKRLDSVESHTALKKSIDKEDESTVLQKDKTKSRWSGAFLPPSFDE